MSIDVRWFGDSLSIIGRGELGDWGLSAIGEEDCQNTFESNRLSGEIDAVGIVDRARFSRNGGEWGMPRLW